MCRVCLGKAIAELRQDVIDLGCVVGVEVKEPQYGFQIENMLLQFHI